MSNQKALTAYLRTASDVRALLARLESGLDAYQDRVSPDEVNYGHVGDMGYLMASLQDLSDRVNEENEYASDEAA
jgi:hypothetical protein